MSNVSNDHPESVAETPGSKLAGVRESLPALDVLVFRVGGAVMVIAALMSWLATPTDARPNLAGIGPTTAGAGLIVLVAGLLLLTRSWSAGMAVGTALGGFTAALIFVLRIETYSDELTRSPLPFEFGRELAAGAWVGVIGAAVALLGATLFLLNSRNGPALQVEMLPALTGAILAVVASTFLVWDFGTEGSSAIGRTQSDLADGFDTHIMTGYPILILGSAALLALLFAMATRIQGGKPRRGLVTLCQVAGIAIVLLAATEIASRLTGTTLGVYNFIMSGPIVAFAGGVFLARSIRSIESA